MIKGHSIKPDFSKANLLYLYFDRNFSHTQIATILDCSRTSIWRLFKKYGIRSRTNAESQTAINETRSPTLTERQKQLIYGSLLGDACLNRSIMRSNKTGKEIEIYKISFYHSEKHLGYIEHKCDMLGTGVKTKRRCKLSTRISGYGSVMKGFSFSHTPTLRKIAKYCLDNNQRKRITTQWLDQLTWHGLAYWFMDDGCLCINKRYSKAFLTFYTQSFRLEEVRLLIRLLKQFGIHAIINGDPNGSIEKYIIRVCRKTDIWEFLRKTEQYIVPCMEYKNRILRNNWETINEYCRV